MMTETSKQGLSAAGADNPFTLFRDTAFLMCPVSV